MISLDEAQRYVLRDLEALAPLEVPLDFALACVSAQVVEAREAVPGFTNSAMDGYALRSDDTSAGPARLRVIGSVLAGDSPRPRLESGEAIRIMTGAPVPDGADCVCMIEEVTVRPRGDEIQVARALSRGENIRPAGEDVAVGQVLVTPGSELGPVLLGLVASQGLDSLLVHPRPKVGVLSTGDELIDSRGSSVFGKIHDVNKRLLLASLNQSGFDTVDLGIARDDYDDIEKGLSRGIAECDAVVSTGGVSVGDADHVKTVITDRCSGRARWMQVAIRPAKPFAFGLSESDTPVFGLPGNPVSTLVSFELFVRPALRLLAGHTALARPTVTAVLDCPIPRRRDGTIHFVHAFAEFRLDGHLHVVAAAPRGSHSLRAAANANILTVVEDGDGLVAGETVRAMILHPAQPDPGRSNRFTLPLM
jgi:molybdenum cofactor synthesis domain-containing protein